MSHWWLIPFAVIVILLMPCMEAAAINNNHMILRSETFLSPLFTLTPGSVVEKFFYSINFPKGHIAMKSFDIEVVDEAGNQVPLSDTHIHHWVVVRYYQHKNATDPNTNTSFTLLQEPNYIIASNNGLCQKHILPEYYGRASESRETFTFLPNPYGIEVGNDAQVPLGYEEKWCLNVHAIDTRSVEDRLGCIECRCHLYNVTNDRFGVPLKPNYKGGMRCCHDKTQCRMSKNDYEQRSLYVRYTVKWVNWDDSSVIPVKVYIFDVTDTWKKPLLQSIRSDPQDDQHHCLVEYDVESCSPTNNPNDECNATKRTRLMFPAGSGYLIYGVAHQHIGGIGATLYGEDGRVLCSSSPIYGEGNNEDGYVVGMSTCYPQPGSVKINNEEMLTLESKYAPAQQHIGVMGLFHIMVAHKLPNSSLGMEPFKVADETNV